jgi:hypothetical protein
MRNTASGPAPAARAALTAISAHSCTVSLGSARLIAAIIALASLDFGIWAQWSGAPGGAMWLPPAAA